MVAAGWLREGTKLEKRVMRVLSLVQDFVKVLLGFVSVVIQKAEWSYIKMAKGEHYAEIFGGTIRREQKTFARS